MKNSHYHKIKLWAKNLHYLSAFFSLKSCRCYDITTSLVTTSINWILFCFSPLYKSISLDKPLICAHQRTLHFKPYYKAIYWMGYKSPCRE